MNLSDIFRQSHIDKSLQVDFQEFIIGKVFEKKKGRKNQTKIKNKSDRKVHVIWVNEAKVSESFQNRDTVINSYRMFTFTIMCDDKYKSEPH